MAKGPGWYPDPWGGTGLRWWDGQNWTENVQGQPGPGMSPAVTMAGGPLVGPGQTRKWYYEWWFIAIMLFFCCSPFGLILVWTRPSTAAPTKLVITVGFLVIEVLLAVAIFSMFPDSFTTGV